MLMPLLGRGTQQARTLLEKCHVKAWLDSAAEAQLLHHLV